MPLVITDLDGCLLDEGYSYRAAREALRELRRRDIPLVLASSKTLAELEPLARELRCVVALIVENGGALAYRPDWAPIAREGPALRLVVLGAPRAALLPALARIAAETGSRLRSFAELTPAELAQSTGLSTAKARRALEREYDEPFLLDGDEAAVAEAAERRGLRVTRGGRFHHLHGPTDKGLALSALLGLAQGALGHPMTVALGDSPNDAPLLAAADHAIVVPLADGGIDPLLAEVSGAERAPCPGPAGWNAAILALLRGEHLPAAAAAPEAGTTRGEP